MDERTAGFVAVFRTFLEEVVHAQRAEDTSGEPGLNVLLETHLGTDPRRLPVVTEDIPAYRLADLDVALGEIEQRGGPARLLGIGGGEQRRHHALSEILEASGRFHQFPVGAVDYSSTATGPDSTRQVVSFGMRLFTFDGAPVAVLQRAADARTGNPAARKTTAVTFPALSWMKVNRTRSIFVKNSVSDSGKMPMAPGTAFSPRSCMIN